LRQMEAAHRDFDEEERRLRGRNEGERIEAGARAQRRAVIQAIKAEIARRPVSYSVTSRMQAEALQAIEKDLAGLAVEELPRSELLQIAEAARDRAYLPAIEEQRKSQEYEEEEQEKELDRQQKLRSARNYADSYLQRELKRSGLDEELDWSERFAIVERVKHCLEMEFDVQSLPELRQTVEELIADEIDSLIDDDEDDEE
jgi:hypothetical protein